MKFYLFVMIALLVVSGCSTKTDTGTDGDTTTTASPDATTSSPDTGTDTKVNATPKDALEAFVAAVKAKDENALKAALSEKSNKMFALQTKMSGKSMLDAFDSKDFEAITKLPETRNEKIDGDKAILETKDPNGDEWDEMPFVRENGSWKVAFLDAEYDKDYENMVKEAEKMSKDKKDDSKKSESGAKGEPETKPTVK